MAKGEVLSCSKFYAQFDGLEDLIVKKVSGISIDLQTAGDQNPFGVTKGGKAQIQATVIPIERIRVAKGGGGVAPSQGFHPCTPLSSVAFAF